MSHVRGKRLARPVDVAWPADPHRAPISEARGVAWAVGMAVVFYAAAVVWWFA